MRAAEVFGGQIRHRVAFAAFNDLPAVREKMPASVIEQVLAQLNERPELSDIGVNELIDQCLVVEKPASAAP